MRSKGIVPAMPDSQSGPIMTDPADRGYVIVRLSNFCPNAANGLATRQTLLSGAAETSKPNASKNNKDISTWRAGWEDYITAVWELFQALYAQANIRRRNKTFIVKTTTSGDFYTADDWREHVEDAADILCPQWILDFVWEINPEYEIEEPNEYKALPGSYLYLWAPSYSTAELIALKGTISQNEQHFKEYSDLLGLPYKPVNLASFCNKEPMKLKTFSLDDHAFLFWSTIGPITRYQAAWEDYMSAVIDGENQSYIAWGALAAHTWMQYTPYFIEKNTGIANDLIAIFRFFMPYEATYNELGCYVTGDVGNLSGTAPAAVAANDMNFLMLAKSDPSGAKAYQFDWVTHQADALRALIGVFPHILLGCESVQHSKKLINNAGSAELFIESDQLMLPNMSVLAYSSTIWSTSYLKEKRYFISKLSNKGTRTTGGSRKNVRDTKDDKTDTEGSES